MTTKEVAARFDKYSQTGAWDKIVSELYAEDCESIEPGTDPHLRSAKGLDAIREKGEKFNEMVEEMHGGFCSPAVVAGDYFSVAMGMDVTMKGAGRQQMEEIALYKVKDGKIVSEQFFY